MNNEISCGTCEESDTRAITVKKKKPQCLICGKNISDRRNLVRHLRQIHSVEPLIRKPQLKCSYNNDCTFVCTTSESLREHLKKAHDFITERKIINFKSRADFDKWKSEEELNTNARYVAYTGTKCRGAKKIYYFKCHRSGSIRLENNVKERKRSKPTKGYTKCGVTCPSSITVSEALNGNIQAIYYPIHLGHTLDDESVQYMKLSLKEKEEILGKLAQGEPVGKIVSDARKKKGSKLSRINLLQRRDVYNIRKKVKYLEKEEDQDGKSIDKWIKHTGINCIPNNPVVLYCPMGKTKDYILILIHNIQKIIYSVVFDGSIIYVKTKKGKSNIDFNLTTVSVVCENGKGYPIAFCISHKLEYITFYTFFKIVYQNFGNIKGEIFVSDNSSQLYSAWKNVMGECDNKLICTFDIQTYWEQKLSALKCPVNKQKEISSQLRNLQHLQDKDAFESDLVKLLKIWEEDEDTLQFASFFQKFYARKRFEWADCYRIHLTRRENINTYLEPINTVLESIYVESYSSLENSLNCLFFFVRDVCLLKLLQWDEQIVLEKLEETKRKHAESVHSIKGIKCSDSEWKLTDEDNDSGKHTVRKCESDCDKKCRVYCDICDVCVHDFKCACSDYVVCFNICKHVHYVAMMAKETKDVNLKNHFYLISSSKCDAVMQAKALALELNESNFSNEKYLGIIEKLSQLRKDISRLKNNNKTFK